MKKIVLAAVLTAVVLTCLTGCSTVRIKNTVNAEDMEKAFVIMKRGDYVYKQKNFKRALLYYDRALQKYEMPVLYKKISYCLYKMGNKSEAMVVYKYAIK